ncbi:unnamed protein product [Schistosoma turkestanicum]|nr:unnamed protein product [Schistosoma turkestanicum]
MHRSFPVENDGPKRSIHIDDHNNDKEKPVIVPQILLNDSNISDVEKLDKTENLDCIVDALRCALASSERHVESENHYKNDIKNLLTEAKSLQDVFSNLTEEK